MSQHTAERKGIETDMDHVVSEVEKGVLAESCDPTFLYPSRSLSSFVAFWVVDAYHVFLVHRHLQMS